MKKYNLGATPSAAVYDCAVMLGMIDDYVGLDVSSEFKTVLHDLTVSAWSSLPDRVVIDLSGDDREVVR